jgi:superfamily II DNA/RNA helicase
MRFSELGLTDAILEAIDHMGFEKATPIQEMAIPHILEGRDLIACAQTGTGKTAAFILPILHKISGKEDTSINTLIVVPTRELAMQIDQEIQGLSYFLSVSSIALYGGGSGRDWDEQRAQLTEGVDILVATPGKLISHTAQGYVDFSKLKHLVLDEADKMLDMGFSDDILRIIAELPKERQTLMFSATMPSKIRELAKRIMVDPAEVALSISKPAAGVTQRVALTFDNQKIPMITHLLKEREEYMSIVHALRKSGFKAYGFSSNLEQEQREELLRGFRSRRIRILVATDVMSRGIDIKEINMVINFDTPFDAEDYVHRVGRTARANTKGEAVTLVNEKDMRKMAEIERLIESEVPRIPLPEDLGPAPEWVVIPKQRKKRPFHKKRKSENR